MIIHDVYIGIGSNMQNPVQQVTTAINELKNLSDCEYVIVSSLYQSPSMGSDAQDDYINAVVLLHTCLTAELLLDALQQLEEKQGRIRLEHWGSRTLDLDILLFGQQVINSKRLKIPHPALHQRAFVLYPLCEIASDIHLPDGRSIIECRNALTAQAQQEITVLAE